MTITFKSSKIDWVMLQEEAILKFQCLNTTKVYFPLCYKSNSDDQGTLLTTGGSTQHMHLQLLRHEKERTAVSHNSN